MVWTSGTAVFLQYEAGNGSRLSAQGDFEAYHGRQYGVILMRLTKIEKETIILFNEGENTANIYTHNTSLKKRLAAFSSEYPDLRRQEKPEQLGGVPYEMDKSGLSVRFLLLYSEERRRKASENARKNGFNRNVAIRVDLRSECRAFTRYFDRNYIVR